MELKKVELDENSSYNYFCNIDGDMFIERDNDYCLIGGSRIFSINKNLVKIVDFFSLELEIVELLKNVI